MNIIDINSLEGFHSLGQATESEIEKAEKELDCIFADEYKVYLQCYKAASVNGHEITGLCESERLNVIAVTKRQRQLSKYVLPNMYVVENLHIDNVVIWQTPAGGIFQTVGNSKPIKLAQSLVEYLQK